MNILDGARYANRQTTLSTVGAASITSVAIGAASSVLSIGQVIENKADILQEKALRKAAYEIRRIVLRASKEERSNYSEISAKETSLLEDLGKGAKLLITRGLATVGTWFIRTIMIGVRGVVLPVFRLLATATGFVLRTIFTNPVALGLLAAAGTAYALYYKFKKNEPEPIKPTDNRMPNAADQGTSGAPAPAAKTSTSTAPAAAPRERFEPANVKPATAAKQTANTSGAGDANKKILIAAMDAKPMKDKKERAAFLAQMDHESLGFTSMVERGEPAYFQKYEGRKNLGNTEPGDGERFKGRGFPQLTGRDNYRIFGKKVGVDLVNNPELASDPELSARIALAYWDSRGLGAKARAGKFASVTQLLNGGNTGENDRNSKYEKYLKEETGEGAASKGEVATAVADAKKGLQIPTYGRLSSTYGNRVDPVSGAFERKHKGIDIATPKGTPVYASTDGKAVVQPDTKGGYGNLLDILGTAYNTRYAHLDSFDVKDGDTVKSGQVVARVGNTGRSTGNHLHFEVRDKKGNDINPSTVMALPPKTIDKASVVPAPPSGEPVFMQAQGRTVRLENT